MSMQVITRFFNLPKTSCFVFGPRGTGKTTWLKQQLPNALWIDLLRPEMLRLYSAYPERLAEQITAVAHTQKDVVIDEVQKTPELLNVVHSLIEQNLGLRFILTGSSARKLKHSGVNLLAGRAIVRNFHPFVAAELGSEFNFAQAMQFGLLPLVKNSPTPTDTLQAYSGLYLKEEVQQEGLVRNIGDFARFLEIMSFSHGTTVNLSNIARECMISRRTVEGYVSILKDLLLCYTIPVFTKRAQRATVAHDKFYYFDTGVFRSLRAQGQLDSAQEISGAALEGMVLQHLQAWNDYLDSPYNIYYWRTQSGVEVDFVVYGANGFWAIEVKLKKHISSHDVKGLLAFADEYPEAQLLLLYCGKEKIKIKNIWCLPIEEFLPNLGPTQKTLLQN
jgi:uncharacterized protein